MNGWINKWINRIDGLENEWMQGWMDITQTKLKYLLNLSFVVLSYIFVLNHDIYERPCVYRADSLSNNKNSAHSHSVI